MTTEAFDLLAALPMGKAKWGDTAAEFQKADALAVLDLAGPRLHFQTRPRGGRKSADAAGIVVAAHLTQHPPLGATSFVVAADAAQAGLILDTIRSFILKAPVLKQRIKVEARRVVFLADGERVSSVEVVPADEASAYGLRPWFTIADEVANWPETPGSRGVWTAMVSALPKVEDSRLLVITSGGSPSHWSYKVLEQARESPSWRVSETPGPLPWVSEAVLADQRALLTESQYARLHLNRWVAGEDRLTTPEQVRACVGHTGTLAPRRGVRYVHGLDIGLVNDRTVLTTAHAEQRDGIIVVVVDHQEVWQGRKDKPVDLGIVERFCREHIGAYRGRLIFDPHQAAQLTQRLRSHRIRTEQFNFSTTSNGRLANTLYRLLRDQLLDLPDDEGLTDELSSVILRETKPGAYRIDTTGDGHDDRVISLALCAQHLVTRWTTGSRFHVASGRIPPRAPALRSSPATEAEAKETPPKARTVRQEFNEARRMRGYIPPGGEGWRR